jgi:hypothetical protein
LPSSLVLAGLTSTSADGCGFNLFNRSYEI